MSEQYQPPRPVEASPNDGGGSERSGNPAALFTSLMEHRVSTESDDPYERKEKKMFNLLIDLRSEVSDLWHPVVANVLEGYSHLVYGRLPTLTQGLVIHDSRRHQEIRGHDLELTDEEAGILKGVAGAVGIEYDPGTTDALEKRTFKLADLELKAPDPEMLEDPLDRWQLKGYLK